MIFRSVSVGCLVHTVDREILAMNIFDVIFFHVKIFSRTKPIAKFFSHEMFITWKNILR